MKEYFIKNMAFFALTVITFLLVKLIIYKSKLNAIPRKANVLRYPLAYRLAPLVTVGYFAVVTALVYIFGAKDWIYSIASGVVAVGGVVLSICWSLWRVVIRYDNFVFTNCFGNRITLMYVELELRETVQGAKWHFYRGSEQVFCMPFFVQCRDKLSNAYYDYIKELERQKRLGS